MVGHLKNFSPIFAQMPDRITNVDFTTVSPTIANTMLVAAVFGCIKYLLLLFPIMIFRQVLPMPKPIR